MSVQTPAERLVRLLRLQVTYGFFATLHWSLAYLFLARELQMDLMAVLVVPGIIYLSSTILLLTLPRLEYRWGMRIGFLLRALTILPYWLWPTPAGIYTASVFFGAALVLFWVPYNLIFFEHRSKTNRAGVSAVYAAIGPFVDVAGALIAGAVVVRFGFPALFAAAFLLGLVPVVWSVRLNPREAVPLRLFDRLRRIRRVRTLMFFDGMTQGVVWPAVPLVTLFFIEGTFEYAGFFAGLALLGAVSALLLGRFSDRRAKRMMFLVPFAGVFAMANLLSAFAVSVLAWGLWRGLATLSMTLFEPFKNTVLLDVADRVDDLYIVREFLLNLGRGTGVLVLALFLHFGTLQAALVVPGILAFIYPVVILVKDIYPEERLVLKPFRSPWRQ